MTQTIAKYLHYFVPLARLPDLLEMLFSKELHFDHVKIYSGVARWYVNFYFSPPTNLCRHIYDWNIIDCDVRHALLLYPYSSLITAQKINADEDY